VVAALCHHELAYVSRDYDLGLGVH